MDTRAEPATHAHHGIDWDYVEAHHHPVTLVRRPVYEGWVLTLFGIILVGLIGLLGWAGYALSTVKAELRPVQAHVRQLQASVAPREPRSPGGEAVPEESAQRLHALDQRLSAVESWTKDTARENGQASGTIAASGPAPRHPTAPQRHQCAADSTGLPG